MKLTTKAIKIYLANWTIENLASLPINPKSLAGNPNGTKTSHWTRRAKSNINNEIVRAFECCSSTRVFPNKYAIVYEVNGTISQLEWMSELEAIQLGLQINLGFGRVVYWHNNQKKYK
jgi:hypothetical protein